MAGRSRRTRRFGRTAHPAAEVFESRTLLSTFYVDSLAAPGGDGSAATPFTDIQSGVDAAAAAAGDDTVLIGPGTYNENVVVNDLSGLLEIRGQASPTAGVSVNGGGGDVFNVTTHFDVTIAGLDISNGDRGIVSVNGSGALTIDGVRARDFNRVGLVVDNLPAFTIRNSEVINSSYGAFSRFTPTVTIENTSLLDNRFDGGQFQHTTSLLISNVTASNNPQRGIAVFPSTGTTEIVNLTAADNAMSGLGVFNGRTNLTVTGGSFTGNAYHGIDAHSMTSATISNVVVSGNGSPAGGAQTGGAGIRLASDLSIAVLRIEDSLIENNAEGFNGGGGVLINGAASGVIERSTIRNNSSAGSVGGGVLISSTGTASAIRDSVIEGNSAVYGGGVYSGSDAAAGVLRIERTTIRNNTAIGDSGEDFVGADGGGVFVRNRTFIVDESTISGNSVGDAASADPASGGGIAIESSTVTVQNSTISGNTAGVNGGGVAVHAGSNRYVRFINATVADNQAGGLGGGIYRDTSAGTVQLGNSLIATNTAAASPDLSGDFINFGSNLVGDGSGSSGLAGNLIGTAASPIDPLIGPLADNGGPTLTHALLAGSPAIEGVSGASNFVLPNDQRGVSRPQGNQRDIGSFEWVWPPQLSLTIRSTLLNETGSGTATSGYVTRPSGSDLSAAVKVALANADTSELSLPASVVIPAGSTSSSFFTVSAVDDGIVDGDQVVAVTASATGYASVTRLVQVVDTTPPNTPPVANDQSVTLDEDTSTSGAVTGTDADGDSLIYQLVSGPTHHFGFSFRSNGNFTYTPQGDYAGTDSFTFRAFDGTDYSDPATVDLNVTPVNDAPYGLALSGSSVDENVDTTSSVLIGTLSASDVDGDALQFSLVPGEGDNDRFEISGSELRLRAGETVDYETQPAYSVTVAVSDGSVSVQQVFNITVIDDPGAVTVDVVPASDANEVSKKFDVAFLSSSEFDAATRIDIASLTAGKTGDEDSLVRDRKTGAIKYRLEDVNGDGLLDLVVSVETSKTGLTSADTEILIHGLADGTAFEVADQIVLSGGGRGKGGGGKGGGGGGGKGNGKPK
jgi:hypothetical protein